MNRVAIIDYELCNLDSIRRAVAECGGAPAIARVPDDLVSSDRIILPGVGHYAAAMANLRKQGLIGAIRKELTQRPRPLLGICLGMHLLMNGSAEGGATEGLGLIAGQVARLQPTSPAERIPHVGWNEVWPVKKSPLLAGIRPGTDFYFVHSYYAVVPQEDVVATSPYCGKFTSAVEHDRIMGVQFHPEKSQDAGFQLIKNFLSL
jgi:imidazole glycerol-phosphate synthase subunit HisH